MNPTSDVIAASNMRTYVPHARFRVSSDLEQKAVRFKTSSSSSGLPDR